MRVALAGVLFLEPDLLLLDEPTNHLDLEAAIWLEEHLRRYPRTLILVSHDRDFLNSVPQKTCHLEGRKLTLYAGGYDQFERTRRERLMLAEKARERQAAERAHIQSFVDRFRYKASKARQAQSRIKML
jgi:ATP-binding cassette subfamily F protein 3